MMCLFLKLLLSPLFPERPVATRENGSVRITMDKVDDAGQKIGACLYKMSSETALETNAQARDHTVSR